MAQLNYNHLRSFWTVAREGRLARAAERLNVSQSVLSVQIKALEHHFGHPLFERRGRTLALTEAGRIALDHAETIFATGRALENRLGDQDGAARPRLRVGALATLSRNVQLMALQPVFEAEDAEITLVSGSAAELFAALEAHRLDILLVNQVPLRTDETPWTAHLIAEQRVSLVGPPSRVGAGRETEALLGEEPLIVPSPASGVRSGFDAFVARRGLTPRIVAEVDDMAMMRLLAREDLGLAVLPPIVVQDELSAGLLVEAATLPEITESFSAITTPRRFPNPLVREILDRAAEGAAAL